MIVCSALAPCMTASSPRVNVGGFRAGPGAGAESRGRRATKDLHVPTSTAVSMITAAASTLPAQRDAFHGAPRSYCRAPTPRCAFNTIARARAARVDALEVSADVEEEEESEPSYNDEMDALLMAEAEMSLVQRSLRWVRCLTRCRPVKGAANTKLLEVRASEYGAGVFAKVDIRANTSVGVYPGVRRSFQDYLAKCERTDNRPQCYAIMCRDGWVLDPTNDDGSIAFRAMNRFDFVRQETAEVRRGVYQGGDSDPTVSLFGAMPGLFYADATLALANEPDSVEGQAEELDRAQRANIGITELDTGNQVVHTLKDITAGEELLWDYGSSYDRSHYAGRC